MKSGLVSITRANASGENFSRTIWNNSEWYWKRRRSMKRMFSPMRRTDVGESGGFDEFLRAFTYVSETDQFTRENDTPWIVLNRKLEFWSVSRSSYISCRLILNMFFATHDDLHLIVDKGIPVTVGEGGRRGDNRHLIVDPPFEFMILDRRANSESFFVPLCWGQRTLLITLT